MSTASFVDVVEEARNVNSRARYTSTNGKSYCKKLFVSKFIKISNPLRKRNFFYYRHLQLKLKKFNYCLAKIIYIRNFNEY